ncbi:MAG: FkbM family methyltransferase [Saprospiraceae bacterium]
MNIPNVLNSINLLFAKIFPGYVTIRGSKVYYSSFDRFLAVFLWKFGWLEGFEMSFFHSFLKPGMILLDIGANMGVYSLTASIKVGSEGKIISFEPDKINLSSFTKSIQKNGFKNIVIHPFAVSDKSGEIFLSRDPYNSGNHQIRKVMSNASGISIQAIALDEFLKDEKKIDIIKIDIQGAEYFAFKGMKQIILDNPQLIIFAEFWQKGLKNMGVEPLKYLELLKSYGLVIYKIDKKNKKLKEISIGEIMNNSNYDQIFLNIILTRNELNYSLINQN